MGEKLIRLRGFAVENEGSATKVGISEISDGTIEIMLFTKREKFEPLITTFRVTPATFSALSSALYSAAHDPSVWHNIEGANNE